MSISAYGRDGVWEMADVILTECCDGVATVTFNRPEVRNAIDQSTLGQIEATICSLADDPSVRVVVLTGAGDHFIAGGDVQMFARAVDWTAAYRRERFAETVRGVNPIMLRLRQMSQPVIASIRGSAAGWGASLALACDLVIAADNARFNLGYTAVGACLEGAGSWFLPRIVGLKKAMELALMSESFDAEAALSMGVVNRVVPLGELSMRTTEWARQLADGPAVAYAETKRLLYGSMERGLADQLEAEALAFGTCAASEDFLEGAKAFLARRKPQFSGR